MLAHFFHECKKEQSLVRDTAWSWKLAALKVRHFPFSFCRKGSGRLVAWYCDWQEFSEEIKSSREEAEIEGQKQDEARPTGFLSSCLSWDTCALTLGLVSIAKSRDTKLQFCGIKT